MIQEIDQERCLQSYLLNTWKAQLIGNLQNYLYIDKVQNNAVKTDLYAKFKYQNISFYIIIR